MTSFADPMQLLNQKVLEKQAAGLLAEAESCLAANDLQGAFGRLHFFLSQNHPQDAAQTLMEKYPEIVILFSARDTLLSVGNQDKAQSCWLAYIEVCKLITDNAFDDASAHIRRARPAFAGTPQFDKVYTAWLTVKSKQLRQALLRGDEQSAKKLEKEIDDKEAVASVRSDIKDYFAISCKPIDVEFNATDFSLFLADREFLEVKHIKSHKDKILLAIIYNDSEYSIVVVDTKDKNATEYLLNNNKLKPVKWFCQEETSYGIDYFFDIDSDNNIYGIVTRDFSYIRLVFNKESAVIQSLVDISHILNSETAPDPWVAYPLQHKNNLNSLYLLYDPTCGDDLDAERYLCIDLIKNKIIHESVHEENYRFDNVILVPGSDPVFLTEGFTSYAGLLDNQLRQVNKTLAEKYWIIYSACVDTDTGSLIFVAVDNDNEFIDLCITDYNLNTKDIYKLELWGFRDLWPDTYWDILNGLAYIKLLNDSIIYDYKNRKVISQIELTSLYSAKAKLVYYKHDKNPYICTIENNILKFIDITQEIQKITIGRDGNVGNTLPHIVTYIDKIEHQETQVNLPSDSHNINTPLPDDQSDSRFKRMLKSVGRAFYAKHLERVRNAVQENTLDLLMEEVSKERSDITTVKSRIRAIASAVRQGYARDL